MLYSMEGKQPPDDPYDLECVVREHQKAALLTMINASTERKAIRGFPREFRLGFAEIGDLMATLAMRHQPISKYFYTGVGVRLQYRDSCLAERVMLGMLDLGRAVLPVHDSFVMRNGFDDELYEQMEKAYEEEFPGGKG